MKSKLVFISVELIKEEIYIKSMPYLLQKNTVSEEIEAGNSGLSGFAFLLFKHLNFN